MSVQSHPQQQDWDDVTEPPPSSCTGLPEETEGGGRESNSTEQSELTDFSYSEQVCDVA